MDYYKVFIGAESEKEASELLRALVEKKLVVGGTIINGPSIFWWKGQITEMPYFYGARLLFQATNKQLLPRLKS